MKQKLNISYLLVLCFSIMMLGKVHAQSLSTLQGVNFQGLVKDTSNSAYSPVLPFSVRFSVIKGTAGVICFQETQSVSALNNGRFNLTIGNGVNTGAGLFSRLDQISSYQDSLYLKVELDLDGSGYQLFSKHLFQSVVFSLFSKYSLDTVSTSGLSDVASTPLMNGLLKWNGTTWVGSADQLAGDTASYSATGGTSVISDTASYGYVSQNINVDTALYSFTSANSSYAVMSSDALSADTAQYASTAGTADSVIYAWHLKGNASLPQFYLGTTDTARFLLRTNNVTRIRLSGAGKASVGNVSSPAELSLNGTGGFLFFKKANGNFLYTAPVNTPIMLFHSDSSAFRGGTASASQYNSPGLGFCSFGFGSDIVVKSRASIAFGDSCEIQPIPPPGAFTAPYTDGTDAFAFGKNCKADGQLSFAIGYRTEALMYRNVAIGYQCKTSSQSANIAIGYMASATGSTAASFGYKTLASGHKSTAIGSYASTNGKDGSFVFGDASATDTVKNSAINQFMVRAAGGTVFYTDTSLAMGAQLMPGSGAWSTLSDSTKKSNFVLLGPDSYVKEFGNMNIYTWNYRSQAAAIRHMGPTAQSFSRLSGLGENNVSINLVDADGITMQMIKAVMHKQEDISSEFDSGLSQLRSEMNDLDYDQLNKQLDRLKVLTKSLNNE